MYRNRSESRRWILHHIIFYVNAKRTNYKLSCIPTSTYLDHKYVILYTNNRAVYTSIDV